MPAGLCLVWLEVQTEVTQPKDKTFLLMLLARLFWVYRKHWTHCPWRQSTCLSAFSHKRKKKQPNKAAVFFKKASEAIYKNDSTKDIFPFIRLIRRDSRMHVGNTLMWTPRENLRDNIVIRGQQVWQTKHALKRRLACLHVRLKTVLRFSGLMFDLTKETKISEWQALMEHVQNFIDIQEFN